MIEILMGVFLPFLLLKSILSQYTIVQSYHYEIDKYFKYQNYRKILLLVAELVVIAIGLKYRNLSVLLVSIALNIVWLFNNNKIKYTNRIKRYLIIYFVFTYLLYFFIPVDKYFISLFIINMPIIHITIVHYISLFIEKVIMSYYIRDAKKIIKDKRIIGVTGSYGKTSCKNIIYDLLKNYYNVCKSPKSYNNKVGIVKSIRENVDAFDEFFICEYGVDRKGGMDRLLKILKPNISLITEVGNQHLLTFKNIENIKNEKLKLARILKRNEIAIINNDNDYLNEEINNLNCKVITYGIKRESKVMAKNIEIDVKGSWFDLYIDGKKIKRLNIVLLGEHNIMNFLGAIGVLISLNIKLDNIDLLAKCISPIEHRLQIKSINDIEVIDDSFNSNEKGFKFAIDILSLMNKVRIVITPGIIEQGDNSKNINYNLGRYMSSKVDIVILVEKNAEVIKNGLVDNNFDKNKIIIKKNFFEAWQHVKKIEDKNKIVLIENDLPSIYLK